MNFRAKTIMIVSVLLTLILQVGSISKGFSQEKPSLSIGDKAPAFKYGSWLKGTPIKNYEKGRLYIFEFWATWCAPCIGSMPHLSEFAKQHKQDVTVTAVNIWEKTGDKPYESSWPKVAKFVKGMGDKMAFNVVTDSKDEQMGNRWMKAAGQSGIPCSFMIKDGIIMWIGHPIEIDSVVGLVMSPDYDVQAAREKFQHKEAAADSAMAPFMAVMQSWDKAIKANQFEQALEVINDAMGKDTMMDKSLGFFKFQTMIEHFNEDSAMAFAREWQKGKPGYIGSTAAVIAQKKGLKRETYLFAMDLIKEKLANPNEPANIYLQLTADLYANMDDYKNAVIYQQQAVDAGKQYLKEGKFTGFILEDTVKEMETKLAEFKKHLK
ncbi:Thiol-disulfide isomerase or thioredoxin [Chitinophaga jiangningensis]|uniref:Thiol-disulfide isomerase or thioredoxin n=1 Tax=Chitinophaga jiangningensis TaxID=1419482 RepID=A0A1M7LRT0_9BACT|nr:TlpA disulfide reductase family protein [Chitinophaga jiangningensis]SHM80961.1 Thiol-disulfide isomerase or thioredoxin [Chitinophaga jiangningensis]